MVVEVGGGLGGVQIYRFIRARTLHGKCQVWWISQFQKEKKKEKVLTYLKHSSAVFLNHHLPASFFFLLTEVFEIILNQAEHGFEVWPTSKTPAKQHQSVLFPKKSFLIKLVEAEMFHRDVSTPAKQRIWPNEAVATSVWNVSFSCALCRLFPSPGYTFSPAPKRLFGQVRSLNWSFLSLQISLHVPRNTETHEYRDVWETHVAQGDFGELRPTCLEHLSH